MALLSPAQDKVKALLKDTITLLCKNGLDFEAEISVDAVIGITLDRKSLFYISINDTVKSDEGGDRESEKGFGTKRGCSPEPSFRTKHAKRRREMRTDDSVSDGADISLFVEEESSPDDCQSIVKQENCSIVKQEPSDNWQESVVDNISAVSTPHYAELTDNTDLFGESGYAVDTGDLQTETQSWLGPSQSQSSSRRSQRIPTSFAVEGSSHPQSAEQFGKHVCKVCGKGYHSINSLKRHMNAHSGKHPYMCEVCNRGFSSPDNLEGHLTKHTGEKKFACPICLKQFGYKCSLRTHMRGVHKETYIDNL